MSPHLSPTAPGLRDAIIAARTALERVRDLAATQEVGGGAVGGLLDLLQALDAGQAAATTLTARIQRHQLAPRATGLTLASFLAAQGPLPGRERRALLRTATTLEGMPRLAGDRGCRFPGCQAPPRYLDLHHVLPREQDGPTTCDNLVGLCRRHHTAVTLGRWSLSMTPDGVVTVRRGRRIATSDPPHRRQLRPSAAATPARGSPAGRSAATTRPPPRHTASSGV